jgi:hypothetical protein
MADRNDCAVAGNDGAGGNGDTPIVCPKSTPRCVNPSTLRPARSICPVCGQRWSSPPNLPDGQATACPTCRTVQVPTVEPPDERYWRWAVGGG